MHSHDLPGAGGTALPVAASRIARNLACILSKRLILANAKIDLLSAY